MISFLELGFLLLILVSPDAQIPVSVGGIWIFYNGSAVILSLVFQTSFKGPVVIFGDGFRRTV